MLLSNLVSNTNDVAALSVNNAPPAVAELLDNRHADISARANREVPIAPPLLAELSLLVVIVMISSVECTNEHPNIELCLFLVQSVKPYHLISNQVISSPTSINQSSKIEPEITFNR